MSIMKKLFKVFLSFFLWLNTIFNIVAFSVLSYYVFVPAFNQEASSYYQKVGLQLRIVKNKIKEKIDPVEWSNIRNSYYQKDSTDMMIPQDTIFEAKSND